MQHAQQLGRYHLLDRVAFGGMAEIYRAKTADAQGRLHVVAVKRVLGHLCEDDEFIQMLIDEARLTALLKHPNIARVYEFSKVQSEYFISMEYVDGKDMRALLERARQNQEWLPEHLIAYIGMQTARGLHAAHIQTDRSGTALNIVHRDVSPSNVLLSYGGEVKLCDFGIAKASGARSQTKTGVIKGKVKYMSPEQAMGRKLDHRSDLFSLGTLLYEMLTLQAPFTATTEIELLFAVRDARKRPIRELRPNLHAELEIVIDRAMAKSRSQRFQNGEEFANSLQAFLDAHYPTQGAATLSQYMRASFAKEIDKENAVLNDFVVDGDNVDAEVGENLLADVLGPDAEYTQFTAAFTQEEKKLLNLPETGNPNKQMRVMSEMTMPGAEDFDAMPTAHKERLGADELGIPEPIQDWGPSAQTMPRAIAAQQQAQARPASVQGSMQYGQAHRDEPEQGQQTVVLQRQTPPSGQQLPSGPTMAKVQIHADLPDLAFDDHIHIEETRILPRMQLDSLALPPASAGHDGLHEASTQILDARNLPPELQQLLQKRGAALAAAQAPAKTPAPAPAAVVPPAPRPLPAKMPSLELTPLDADFHEANTAYLDWSPLSTEHGAELPMPDPSSVNVLAGLAQRLPTPRSTTAPPQAPVPSARPVTVPPMMESAAPALPEPELPLPSRAPAAQPSALNRVPLGPQQPLAPRSATGMQQPVAPRSATGMQPPIAPRSAPEMQPIAPRSATGMQQPIAPRPAPEMQPIAPRSATGMQQPIAPRSATGMQQPIAPRSATGMQQPVRSATGMHSPISGSRPADGRVPFETQDAPGSKSAARQPVINQEAGKDEEWESLPHLDSTMLSHAGGMPAAPAMPAVPLRKFSPKLRDRGDLPTIQPQDVPARLFQRAPVDEPVDHTIAGEMPAVGGGAQFEDLPTPVKGTPVRDLGFEPDSEFAEDTNKGDGPRGMASPASGGDPSVELSDLDFEDIE